MKTFFGGVKMSDNDAEIVAFLGSEGLLGRWEEEVRKKDAKGRDCIMIYLHHEKRQVWIVQKFTGVPGDEGLTLQIYPQAMIEHPSVQMSLIAIEKIRKIHIPRAGEMEKFFTERHIPKKGQN